MKKHIFFATITLVLLLLSIYFLFLSSAKQSEKITISPTLVEVAVVDYHNIPITAKSTGKLIAPNFVTLKSQIAGIVEQITFTSVIWQHFFGHIFLSRFFHLLKFHW